MTIIPQCCEGSTTRTDITYPLGKQLPHTSAVTISLTSTPRDNTPSTLQRSKGAATGVNMLHIVAKMLPHIPTITTMQTKPPM